MPATRSRGAKPRRLKIDRRAAWRAVADAEGGTLEEGKRPSKDRVHFEHGPWRLHLDTYTVNTGKVQVTYTRVRAYFLGHRDLRLTVRARNVFDRLFGWLSFGSAPPVNPSLTERFVVKGKPSSRIPSLFLSDGLSDALLAVERIHLYVRRPSRRSRKKYGEESGVVGCQATGVVKDPDYLASMVRLVRVALDTLHRVGEANDTPVPES